MLALQNLNTFDLSQDMSNHAQSQSSNQMMASSNGVGNQALLEQMRYEQGSQAARESVIKTMAEHHRLKEERGFGTHYGDTSTYSTLIDEEKQSYLQDIAGEEAVAISPDELTKSSCIEWAMEHVRAWYQATGQLEIFEAIDAETRNADLKGTELAKILVGHGWQAWYSNPDTSYQGPEDAPDSEHSYSNHVAQTQGTYYDVPLSGSLVDTDQSPELFQALEAMPFFLMVSRGGMHVTAGVDGEINELARNEGPDSDVIYQDPLRDIINVYADIYGGGEEGQHKARHLWGSGLILLPPGAPPLGVEFTQRDPSK